MGTFDRPLDALLVYYNSGYPQLRLTMAQHIRFLERSGHRHRIVYWNCGATPARWLRRLDFDLVVLHYSALAVRWQEQFERRRRGLEWLADSQAVKIAMPQDEYDRAAVLDEWLDSLSVDAVMSVLHPRTWPTLYPRTSERAVIERTLTGFVDESAIRPFDALSPHSARPFDIVYRARALPFRYGSVAQMKHRIAEIVDGRAEALNLRTDISTELAATKYGRDWLTFLESGRAVIGSESGVSALDAHWTLREAEERLLATKPDISFEEFAAAMPAGWDAHRFTAISPRSFESASAGCAQFLIEGEYSGVLEPDTHYVPIKQDLTNLDEVLSIANDPGATERLARRAHEDLVLSRRFTYRTLAEHVERLSAQAASNGRVTGRRRPGPLAPHAARAQSFVGAELFNRTYWFIAERLPVLVPPIRSVVRFARRMRTRAERMRRANG